MTVQVTDVCSLGARTVTYPEAIREDAVMHYERVCKDPKTLYAQMTDNHEVRAQFVQANAKSSKEGDFVFS